MTLAAEQVMQELRRLPPEERRQIWQQLSQLVVQTSTTTASDAEFEAALDELTGCTTGHNTAGRLLEERRRERQREQALVTARANSGAHA